VGHGGIIIFENFAYLSEEDRQRHGFVDDGDSEKFFYQGLPPQEISRIEGTNGTMLSVVFKDSLKAFQMGGHRMVKIEVIVFDD